MKIEDKITKFINEEYSNKSTPIDRIKESAKELVKVLKFRFKNNKEEIFNYLNTEDVQKIASYLKKEEILNKSSKIQDFKYVNKITKEALELVRSEKF